MLAAHWSEMQHALPGLVTESVVRQEPEVAHQLWPVWDRGGASSVHEAGRGAADGMCKDIWGAAEVVGWCDSDGSFMAWRHWRPGLLAGQQCPLLQVEPES